MFCWWRFQDYFPKRIMRLKEWILRSPSHKLPVYLATPLNVISSIMVGSDRPFAFAENKIIRYELPASRLSMKNETGGFCKRQAIKYFINILSWWKSFWKLTNNVKFLTNFNAGISTSSNRNICGKPPSNPSTHSTWMVSMDWLEIVQFCKANGLPVN